MNIEFRNSKTNAVLETWSRQYNGTTDEWSAEPSVPRSGDVVLICPPGRVDIAQFSVVKVFWRNQENVVCYIEPF